LSSDREAQKAEFLARAGLGDARRERLAGDASTRMYERLHRPGAPSLIFMDQPPSAETQPCPPDATPAERMAFRILSRVSLVESSVTLAVPLASSISSVVPASRSTTLSGGWAEAKPAARNESSSVL